MGAFIVDQLLERNPDVGPGLIEDLFCGCGMPQGLQAFNIGRIISLLSERLPETVNGVTVSRYCSSSLDAIRHAGNAIKAGEGDAYIARRGRVGEPLQRAHRAGRRRRPEPQAAWQGRHPERLHRDGRSPR